MKTIKDFSSHVDVLIIGAGPAGLGAADRAKLANKNYLILEEKNHPYGHCASFKLAGIDFDEGPHVSFTKNEQVKTLFAKSCPDFLKLEPVMINHWKGYVIPHPVQSHLAYLPEDISNQVLQGILQRPVSDIPPKNYHEWLKLQFGDYFTNEFSERYTQKYWTLPTKDLGTDWVGQRVVVPSIESIKKGLLDKKVNLSDHYFQEFRYPERGGFQSFFSKTIEGHISQLCLNAKVTAIDALKKTVTVNNQYQVSYNHLCCSIPLDLWPSLILNSEKNEIEAADKLLCSSVKLFSFVFKSHQENPSHWGYVYDEDIPFARYYFPKSLMGERNASIQAIQVEVYSSKRKNLNPSVEEVISALEKLNLLKGRNILESDVKNIKYANVIFDQHRAIAADFILSKYKAMNIYGIGRFGHWKYLWSDESYLDGWDSINSLI